MPAKNSLSKIKKHVEAFVGRRVKLKANRGRRKTFEKEGILEKTYPNIFVVKIEDEHSTSRRVSYSYSDILTQTVELTVFAEDGKKRIKWAG